MEKIETLTGFYKESGIITMDHISSQRGSNALRCSQTYRRVLFVATTLQNLFEITVVGEIL